MAGHGAPPLMTERDEARVADCAFAALVMLIWWAGAKIRITRECREELARTANKPEGHEAAGEDDLQAAVNGVYGFRAHSFVGSFEDLRKLDPEAYCVLFGVYAELPADFQKHDVQFSAKGATSFHAVGYRPRDRFWQDPDIPPAVIKNGFNGRVIQDADAERFARKYKPDGLVHALWIRRNEIGGPSMAVNYNLERWKLPAGTKFFAQPGGRRLGEFASESEVTALGTPIDDTADDNLSQNWRAVFVTSGSGTHALGATFRLVYVQRPTDPTRRIPTEQAWDDAVKRVLGDATFRG
jgi:hypothetical protein